MKVVVSDPTSTAAPSDPVLFPTNLAYAVAIACIVAEMLFSSILNVLLRLSASRLAPERRCCRRRRRPARYVLCTTVGYLASLCWLYAVLRLPLAVATSLFFTTALFMGGMARWVLREPLTRRDWIGPGMGLGGVALVLRPSFEGIRADGVLAALMAAGLAALAPTLLESLSGIETPATSALLRLAPAAPLAALPAFAVWSVPSWAIMTAIAVASVGGQTLLGGGAIVAAALLSRRKDRRVHGALNAQR